MEMYERMRFLRKETLKMSHTVSNENDTDTAADEPMEETTEEVKTVYKTSRLVLHGTRA